MVERYISYLLREGLRPRTAYQYGLRLKILLGESEELTEEKYYEFIDPLLMKKASAAMINIYAKAARKYLKWKNITWSEPPKIYKEDTHVKPIFSVEEIVKLIEAQPPELKTHSYGQHSIRQRLKTFPYFSLFIETAIQTGGRPSEVLLLKTEHIDFGAGSLQFVDTKGKRDREVPLPPTLLHKLEKRCSELNEQENIFPFSIETAGNELKRRCKELGIIRGRRSLHSFRRFYATDLDNNGVGLKTIKELLGHTSIETTDRYIGVSLKKKRDAVMKNTLVKRERTANERLKDFVELAKNEGFLDQDAFEYIIEDNFVAIWKKGTRKKRLEFSDK